MVGLAESFSISKLDHKYPIYEEDDLMNAVDYIYGCELEEVE